MDYFALADRALAAEPLSRDEALSILRAPDEDVPELVAAAHRLRRRYFADSVKVNFL